MSVDFRHSKNADVYFHGVEMWHFGLGFVDVIR